MKRFYKENRVFVILMGIALICIAIIVGIFTKYVLDSTSSDKYGNRLDGINDVLVTDSKKSEIESSIIEMAKVQDVTINIHGKIINFIIDFENDTSLNEMQNVAIDCLELFDESYLNFYDLEFFLTQSKLEVADDEETEENSDIPVIGYRKAGAKSITWSNNAK